MDHIGPARLRALLDSVLAVASELDLSTVLGRIVASAADLADARYAALGVLDETGTELADFLTVGMDDEVKAKIGNLPRGHGILGMLIVDPKPLRLPNLAEHSESYGFPPNHPPMTSFLGVPIRLHNRVFGNLYLTDKRSAEVFSDIDEEVVVTLASAAAIAIENARLHAQVEEMAVVQDRERIARDLHDTVIQRLFAAGLSLQATAQRTSHDVTERIESTVDELDSIIREVRSVIFQLEEPKVASGLRLAVRAMAAEVSRVLGFEVVVDIDDLIDDVEFSADARHGLITTLREALTNVARHAKATAVEVVVVLDDDDVVLKVADNGCGLNDQRALGGKGIANAAERAKTLGGSIVVADGPEGGTVLEWRVPLKVQ